MENEKIKSRPGKVMGNKNLAESHEKSWNFDFYKCLIAFLLRKMCSLATLLTHNDTGSPPIAVKYFTCKK